MQIDIAAHIEKLLFLHDTLNIPGFGGFTASRTPAAADYAGGTVAPPAKALAFSENLTVDDGLLVSEIVKEHSISADDAREAIRQFVEQMQTQLNQREIVSLPGIGRLYKNYVQKIQFLPDATNFNAGSYGLPPLQFSPISRSREVAEKPAETVTATNGATTTVTAPPPPAETAKQPAGVPPIPPLPAPPNFVPEPYSAPRSSATRFGTGIGIGLIICTAVFGIWWWQYKKDRNRLNTPPEMVLEDTGLSITPVPGAEIAKLTEKPKPANGKTQARPVEREDQDLNDEVDQAAAARAAEAQRRRNETSTASTSGQGRLCVLVVATLSDQTNVERLIAKLEGGGYKVYHRQGRGHQVGISFYYTNPAEIEQKKTELIRFTGEKGVFVKTK